MDREQILANAEKFQLEAFSLVIACVIMLLSGAASYITGEGLWFTRSGSLAVLISAIIEFRNFGIQQKLNEIAQESAAY